MRGDNIQISKRLFMQLCDYFLSPPDWYTCEERVVMEDKIIVQLQDKLNRAAAHDQYTTQHTKPSDMPED